MIKNEKVIACYGKQLPLPGTSEKDQLDLNIVFKDETTEQEIKLLRRALQQWTKSNNRLETIGTPNLAISKDHNIL